MRVLHDVSAETRHVLQRLSMESQHQRVRQRTHCLVLSCQGFNTTALRALFSVHRLTIYHWVDAWEAHHCAGLYDQKRCGRPPKLTAEDQDQAQHSLTQHPSESSKGVHLVEQATSKLVSALLVVMGRSTPQEVAQAVAPPEVEVVPVAQRDVPVYGEWIGTLEGMVNATIKAQVTGYLRQQRYTEGALVTPGQVLFAIDQRPFQAALDQAKGELAKAQGQLVQANAQLVQANAQLAQAEANQGKTQLDVDRYIPLAKAQAISAQDLDNAVQNNLAAKAQVAAAKAGIEVAKAAIVAAKAVVEAAKAQVATATLTLGFTTIVSPITGIAGIATAQVGDLVGPNSGTLTTVSTLDPIKVYQNMAEDH